MFTHTYICTLSHSFVWPFSANIAVARSYLSAATKISERTQAVSMVSLAQVIPTLSLSICVMRMCARVRLFCKCVCHPAGEGFSFWNSLPSSLAALYLSCVVSYMQTRVYIHGRGAFFFVFSLLSSLSLTVSYTKLYYIYSLPRFSRARSISEIIFKYLNCPWERERGTEERREWPHAAFNLEITVLILKEYKARLAGILVGSFNRECSSFRTLSL